MFKDHLRQKWRPRQDKPSIQKQITTEQLTKAIGAKLEILKITMEQSVTDEVHDFKITVHEDRFEAEEDIEDIGHFGMECTN